jgi:hypothetical protein
MGQQLIVEGQDAIVLANLLKKRGLPPPEGYSNPMKFRSEFVRMAGGYSNAINAFREALENPDLSNIGLVIDADEQGVAARWREVKSIILDRTGLGVDDNDVPPVEGVVINLGERFPMPIIGVWIMPNNRSNGYLEHFVAQLIPENDGLWSYAEETIRTLETKGLCRFAETKRQKALLHSWLAWQAEPGKPFGLAVEMGYLDAGAQAAVAFVEWFQQVFRLEA